MSIEPATAAAFVRWIFGVVGGITALYGALYVRRSFDFKALQPGTTRRRVSPCVQKGPRNFVLHRSPLFRFRSARQLVDFDLLLLDNRSGLSKALSTPILSVRCFIS